MKAHRARELTVKAIALDPKVMAVIDKIDDLITKSASEKHTRVSVGTHLVKDMVGCIGCGNENEAMKVIKGYYEMEGHSVVSWGDRSIISLIISWSTPHNEG